MSRVQINSNQHVRPNAFFTDWRQIFLCLEYSVSAIKPKIDYTDSVANSERDLQEEKALSSAIELCCCFSHKQKLLCRQKRQLSNCDLSVELTPREYWHIFTTTTFFNVDNRVFVLTITALMQQMRRPCSVVGYHWGFWFLQPGFDSQQGLFFFLYSIVGWQSPHVCGPKFSCHASYCLFIARLKNMWYYSG